MRASQDDPFGEQPQRVRGVARDVRRRIGGLLAAVAALIAKFFSAIKGVRAMAPMAPAIGFAGLAALVGLAFIYPNPILLIIIVVGGFEAWRRWKLLRTRSLEVAAYYRVPARSRLLVGLVYVGLIVLLAAG